MMLRITTSALTICVITMACADTPTGHNSHVNRLFQKANKLYDDGDFAAACRMYERCVAAGANGADVLYNLGNCHARQDKLGKALAAYHGARRTAPRDPDILYNIQQVEALRVGTTRQVPRSWLAEVIDAVVSKFTLNELLVTCLIILLIASAVSVRTMLALPASGRTIAVICGLWLLVAIAGAACVAGYSKLYWSQPSYVVSDARMRAGPGQQFEVTARLNDGARVQTRAKSGMWTEIVLPTGKHGWVRGDRLTPIYNSDHR